MVLGGVLGRLMARLDTSDALLVIGLTTLICGIGAVSRPAAAIVFGSLCLVSWAGKNWKNWSRE